MPNLVNLGLDTSGRTIYLTPRMRAAFDEACDRAGVVPTIVQGAYMTLNGGGASKSAGYHDKAGCIDTRVWNLTTAEQNAILHAAREVGWAVWLRDHRHGMDPHMHWVLGGEPDMAPGAAWQWTEYLAGRDGLTSRGPDYHWRPTTIRPFTWSPEEDDMPTPDEFWNHPVPKHNGKGWDEEQPAKWAVAQARQASRRALEAIGDVAQVLGNAKLTDDEKADLVDRIAKRTAAEVERLDAEAVADRLEITPKEKP